MAAAGFTISRDTATPRLRRLARKLDPEGSGRYLLQWGAATRRSAQRNALAKGGRRFWKDMARSVRIAAAGPRQVDVVSDHVAAAQKQFGGPIVAKGSAAGGAEMLTIPISVESEGRRASEFTDAGEELVAIYPPSMGDKGLLGWRHSDWFEPLFLLTEEVDQEAEPWWPTERETMAEGIALGERLVRQRR